MATRQFIREANAGYGSTLKWTHTTDARRRRELRPLGRCTSRTRVRYRVEAYTPAPYNGSKQAVYKVHHDGTVSDAPVDQSAVDGWNLLGEFEFEAGGHGQFIRVDDNTGEPNSTDTQIVFDALRFTLVTKDDGEPGDGDEPPAGDDAAGCTATHASSHSCYFGSGSRDCCCVAGARNVHKAASRGR